MCSRCIVVLLAGGDKRTQFFAALEKEDVEDLKTKVNALRTAAMTIGKAIMVRDASSRLTAIFVAH